MQSAVRAVLQRRAHAVLAHDEAGLLADVDPAARAFRGRQARWLGHLVEVPLASWAYELAPRDEPAGPPAAGAAVAVGVVLRYQLAGFDARPVSVPQVLLLRQQAGRWLLCGQDDTRSAHDLWDAGPVIAVRGRSSLVLAHPEQRALARRLAPMADRAVSRVTGVWGRRWAQRVVVLVATDASELAALAQTDADLSAYAAVQSAELPATGDGDPTPVGDRVAVDAPVFSRSSPRGQQVVLTHEVTHVASRASTGALVPQWLVEGLADHVGFAASGLPPARVAVELLAEVRAGRLPAALPADEEWSSADDRLAAVYEEAWLATGVLAERFGDAGLVALYREVGAGEPLEAALRARGTSVEGLVADWQVGLRRLAAGSA